ncbi:MAG: sodium:proline symporter [Granulosicoccus sp.]|nr:sodium:proline symporter [Granulosicoccus sp.]
MNYLLPVFATTVALISISLTRKSDTVDSFFGGKSSDGQNPTLLTLVLSQTTTWIFARSLLNSAILGYYYGIWGTLAYATYYLSFLTGSVIVDQVRFRYGYTSIQDFLRDRFGAAGPGCYNIVVALRLISEVFANLLVIGILFGSAGSSGYTLTILAFASVTLLYSMLGGLQASLRTDVFQMIVFLITLTILLIVSVSNGLLNIPDLLSTPFVITDPGPVLIVVALLQVWSYPMHDPVMMDRGFIADRETTRKSFYHAFWLSTLCIIAFGCLGVAAGSAAVAGEDMNTSLTRILGETPMLLFSAALIVSAMSTLDSTLCSSAKLIIMDVRWLKTSIWNGRVVMTLFMLMGLGFVFLNNKDLFSAVAVSGTASMYLFPVIFFSLIADKRNIPVWSYLLSFVVAFGGAMLYFLESSAHTTWLGDTHKYTKLLWIAASVLLVSCAGFFLGVRSRSTAE